MRIRRSLLLLACAVCLPQGVLQAQGGAVTPLRPASRGPAGVDAPEVPEMTPEATRAVERALSILASHQSRQGAFGTQYPVAITALTGLAYLAHGNVPGEGRYEAQVRGAMEYLLRASSRSGYITEPGGSQSRMHGHGFATMFLCEVWGMDRGLDPELREWLQSVIRRAIDRIEQSQTRAGGWGYEPTRDGGEENSITVCVVAALRAARNAGFAVDRGTVDRAVRYVKRCHNAADGSFRYDLSPGDGTFALTAAAVSTLHCLGEYDSAEVRRGLEYLLRHQKTAAAHDEHFFYQQFYAALALWQTGGERWTGWFPVIRDDLVRSQPEDGLWTQEYGPEYSTAWACLILQIPSRYLPIFQR